MFQALRDEKVSRHNDSSDDEGLLRVLVENLLKIFVEV